MESCYLDLESSLRELTNYEKERLRVLFGSIETYNIIKRANSRRKSGHKPLPVRELKRLRDTVSIILDLKIKDFSEKYKHLIRENYLLMDMLEKIVIRNYDDAKLTLY